MGEVKKPEKLKYKDGFVEDKCYGEGYNHCVDTYEKFLPNEIDLHDIFHKASGLEITLDIARGLKALARRIGK